MEKLLAALVTTPETSYAFIDVWNCRCAVSRYRRSGGRIAWETASNWEELEDAARAAVEALGGSVTESGHYPCPDSLAERAVWPPA
jgi:hypothetical protein